MGAGLSDVGAGLQARPPTLREAEIDQLRAEQERALERVARTIQWIDQRLEQEPREQAPHQLRMR